MTAARCDISGNGRLCLGGSLRRNGTKLPLSSPSDCSGFPDLCKAKSERPEAQVFEYSFELEQGLEADSSALLPEQR